MVILSSQKLSNSKLKRGDKGVCMGKKRVIKAIKFLEKCLKEKGLNLSKIILFGSQAKGKSTEESDVDILIVSEDFHGKDIFERAALTKYAEIMTIQYCPVRFLRKHNLFSVFLDCLCLESESQSCKLHF